MKSQERSRRCWPPASIISSLWCFLPHFSCYRPFCPKGDFWLCNFVSNFLVAKKKWHGKLQPRAIIPTRGCWIFIARNFLAQCLLYIHWGRVWHALYAKCWMRSVKGLLDYAIKIAATWVACKKLHARIARAFTLRIQHRAIFKRVSVIWFSTAFLWSCSNLWLCV